MTAYAEDIDEIYEFKALITYSRYYNEDNFWGIFGFSTQDYLPYYQKPSKTDWSFDTKVNQDTKYSTLAGNMQQLIIGAEYNISAYHKHHPKYGDQYIPIAVTAITPHTKEEQLTFLKCIVSERIALNLIGAYPNLVDDVIKGSLNDIEYKSVRGVGEKTWIKIRSKIIENFTMCELITFLRPLGIPFNTIQSLWSHAQEENPALYIEKIKKNPYIITNQPQIGFKRADEFALKVKPELINSKERLIAYIWYYLKDLGETEGHTWVSKDTLINAVTNTVPECINVVEDLFNHNNSLYIEGDKVGLKYYHDTENKIFQILSEKAKRITSVQLSQEDIDTAVKEAEKEQGFVYTDEQKAVIVDSLNRTVSLITGKAGVGKSSVLRAIIKAYDLKGYSVSASALSAMASKRITEATGYEAATIHRALGCKGVDKFMYNKDCHIPAKVVFLDEGSMVGAQLFLTWLEAVGDDTRIIISGDNKQLPPIGFGNVFSDLINVMNKSAVSYLTKVMRQAQKSGILVDANIIRDNRNPVTENLKSKLVHGELKDMYYMFRQSREALFNIAVKAYINTAKTEGVENIAIVVPRKKGCLNSAFELNNEIQKILLKKENMFIKDSDRIFKLGAKVIQTVNDYEKNVFNGEIGYITYIGKREVTNVTDNNDSDIHNNKKKSNELMSYCAVTFKENDGTNKEITYWQDELSVLDLAYALTCHKCQGSGIKIVIGIVDDTHYQLLDNCMLYTMLTRAKKRCLLLAEPSAFLRCIRTSRNKRNTWLARDIFD